MKRPFITFVAVTSLIGCALSIHRAIRDIRSPSTFPAPGWANGWPDYVGKALGHAMVAGACGTYLYRRWSDARQGGSSDLGFTEWAPLWRQRKELRLLIYGFAALVILEFPGAMIKATEAHRAGVVMSQQYRGFQPDPWWDTFREAITFDDFLGLAVAAGLIIYDQRRLRSETRQERKSGAFCLVCGYDLRASPNRCPECGTVIKRETRPSTEQGPITK